RLEMPAAAYARRAPVVAPPVSPTPRPFAVTLFGAATSDLKQLSTFESHARRPVDLYSIYKSFADAPRFDRTLAAKARDRGDSPMVTWEPWDASGGVNQPDYSLRAIADGRYDALIRAWARDIKAYGSPVWLRFAHEMNGYWYPWSEGVNGNAPGSYVA